MAFRTERLPEMVELCGEVLGLGRVDDPPFEGAAFSRAGDGVAGHTRVLVPFDRSGDEGYVPPDSGRTTVDHVAFGIDPGDFDAEVERLEAGLRPRLRLPRPGRVALAVPRRPGRQPRRTRVFRPRVRPDVGRIGACRRCVEGSREV